MSRLVLVLSLLVVAGCKCDPQGTNKNKPDFDPTPKALSFEACPTQDEGGIAVKDVFPDEQKVSLINLGKASGQVLISFSGTNPEAFSVPDGGAPTDLGAGESTEFPVRFAPTRRGEATATMTIEDGNDTTPPVTVALQGNGRNLPSQPSLFDSLAMDVALQSGVKVQNKDLPDQFDACFVGGLCQAVFADTFYKDSSTLSIKIKNLGCPTLKITGMDLQAMGGSQLAFFLDEPAVPPSVATPMLLTTSEGNAETVLKVRFAPTKDTSGSDLRVAILTLKTNDPANPTFDISLYGSASDPKIYVTPTFCDFTDPADLCGNATKVANKGRFDVHNGGGVPVVIDSVKFQKVGQTRFAITTSVQGQTIAAGGVATLEVTHSDAPLYVNELLTISAVSGSPARSAGNAYVSLSGGTKPCLSTEPVDQLNFEDAGTELSTQKVKIKNGGCPGGRAAGDLVINRAFADVSPFFTIVDPLIPAGEVVPDGSARFVTVQYKKPLSGGTQTGVLRIDTNDPDYGPPPYKVVLLYSNSPLDQLPTAVLKACLPTDATCGNTVAWTVHLSALPAGSKTLKLSGLDSFDPGNVSPTPISGYRFRLVVKPSNATAAVLENDGVKGVKDNAILTLDPAALGIYKVSLLVWDDKGQQAALASEITLSIAQ
jgi:hypothetical protein